MPDKLTAAWRFLRTPQPLAELLKSRRLARLINAVSAIMNWR